MLYVLGGLTLALALWLVAFVRFQQWHTLKTRKDAYFSLPLAQRRELKRHIKRLSRLFHPLFLLLAKMNKVERPPLFHYQNYTGPAAIASPNTFKAAQAYKPSAQDIFVVTQMKCGTTWMQQMVFEILHHGKGNLSDTGYRHLYALSPWIETRGSVPLEKAPLVATYQNRIIKTHMPFALCPFDSQARYIYVTRHPVGCFNSAADFISLLLGPFAPTRSQLLDWFLSDDMYWGHWARHVEEWWQASQTHNNILFMHFEAMKQDPRAAIEQVADFLGTALDEKEKQAVLEKCSFSYMQEHEEQFEMAPPSPFSVLKKGNHFLRSGASKRDEGLSEADKQRIIDFCRNYLAGKSYPAKQFYPELSCEGSDSIQS